MTDESMIRIQFDLIAKQYDEGRRCLIPCLDDFYVRSVSLLRNLRPHASRIIDLGAGTGLLAKQVHMLYPDAAFTLVDLSDDMLNIARQRFAGIQGFDYIVADYSKYLPCNADIICSALSIHHLENADKQLLYAEIFSKLPDGGVFINLDQFCADSPIISSAWNQWWLGYIDGSGITDEARAKWIERRKLDREISIPDTIAMLRKAGFRHAECVYQFMKFATIVAVR